MTTANKINRLDYLIGQTERKINKLTNDLETYRNEIRELNKDELQKPVKIGKKLFEYGKDLEKYKQSKEYKLQTEPYFRCNICNVAIFDGVWNVKDLVKNTNKLLNSNYRKHREICSTSCNECGIVFTSRHQKNSHKCCEKKVNKPMTNMCDTKAYYKKKEKQKEQSPTPEPVSSPEPIKCEISEIESDSEYESWQSNYKTYNVGNKTKRVYDEYDEQIGYLYQNRLIHSDDDIYDDFIDSLKDI